MTTRGMKYWAEQAFFRALERFEVRENLPCEAYGGCNHDRTHVRLCGKRRWHLDSHAYEWQPLG